ncbi:MAG: Wzz/FepE/Etk N-terminal domain-containing protein [Bacteroidota bacterium]
MEDRTLTTEAGGDGTGLLGAPPVAPPHAGSVKPYQPFWWAATRLYRWRWLVLGMPLLIGIISVAITLQMPNVYRARTTVMLPNEGGGGLVGSLLGLPPGAQALLGGGESGYTRYLAILTSRTVAEKAIDRFGLIEAYEMEDDDFPRQRTREAFSERVEFPLDLEFNHLAVEVLDESPERAAQIANFLIEVLNQEHIRLTASSAGERRAFLGTRLQEAEFALDSTQASLQALQERYGVVEIESQAQALMSSLALAQGAVSEAEVAYQALLSQYGPENAEVQAAQAALQAARSQVSELTGGDKSVMPVPLRNLPAVSRQYASVMQELLTQQEILRVVRPLYEEAVISERRHASAVQVLDPAIPPELKAAPKRSILVLLSTFATGLFTIGFILVWSWWRESGRLLLAQLIQQAKRDR